MSEPEPDLLPTVTLQHRYGEQRIRANRADYIRGKDGRFRNWLLASDDPELRPVPCRSLSAPAQTSQPPKRSTRRNRRGRRK
ncbi:hypothetical protein NUH88_08880 [Nisaea acidiphila]|uniref:Uncharacterized protein n=1 Tax=Nisaea acidiphila TaxID=1862145 RepID=A0A9J7AZF4_9PROT|nr:hypothetical protein [Nisaea acidiphila]UUX51801.1 hypothetical protein NUH88_08880 [Nisaea acidiphila]